VANDDSAPLISVIIPCYNAEAYLAEAIESALGQKAGPLEVVVIDDGSTDGSGGVARRFGRAVRYEYQANGGISAARNRGVEVSTGRYLAFLDADDVWPDASLALRLDMLRAHPGTACVFGAMEEFLSPDLHERSGSHIPLVHTAQVARLAGSMLIEREAFVRVGFFDPQLTVGETLDWIARAEDAGIRVRMADAVVLRRRIHGDNTVTREKARQNDYLRALRTTIARRRAKAG
jgi:glycosyltransferase involved in cell wall biosynthesis